MAYLPAAIKHCYSAICIASNISASACAAENHSKIELMTQPESPSNLLARLSQLGAPELRRLLVEHLTKRKLGLTWERNAIEHDEALNVDIVLPRLVPELSHKPMDAERDSSTAT
ncbi:hypothetical protein [Tahibacter soli]|uniref:Uncharacterized protein n=1 Tax=Tahibacter soli TaxID=2983605 RepID=A0A9X3YPZ6_9GAMM|nr:hypothetical protein [Tahibacter soli]MDC8015844.1 hypothetical protein [Tahibacter soli]